MVEAEVQLASPDDAGQIAAVLLAAFRDFEPLYTPAGFRATTPTAEEVVRRLADGPTWIALDDRDVVGTVSAVERGGEIHLRSMAVLPSARGRRIATRLLHAVEAFALSRGARRLSLATTPFLTGAIRLYEQAGFSRRSAPLDLHGTPLFAMVKELDEGPSHNDMQIRPVSPTDAAAWLQLRQTLWPDGTEAEHREDIDRFFAGHARDPQAVLVAEDSAAHLIGVAELSIRPYAEGCHSDRVAYLEGWFIVPEARGRGVGRALIAAAEEWGRSQGCREFASDAEADNAISAEAHRALGFTEVGLVRCFRKDL